MTDSPVVPPNPYTPGQVPRVLAGRGAELRRIRDLAARVAAYGELGGPPLVFHAPRGLGKTSLLRIAQRRAGADGFLSAWISCSRRRPFLPEVVHVVARTLERADFTPDGRRRWHARLDRVGLEFGLPGVRVSAEIDTGADAAGSSAPPGAPIAALEDLLHEAATLVRAHGGAGLLVFLDELHAAAPDDLATLLNALQNLDGEREENPLAVIAAGLPVTPEAITGAATFGERSTFVALDVLAPDDAATLLTAPAEALGVQWTPDAVDLVVEEARGHPYFLQLMGQATWDAAAVAGPRGDSSSIDADAVRAGVPAAAAQLDAMYRTRWRSATRSEQRFLAAMARAATDSGGDHVARAQIAGILARDSRALSVPRERLIEKGVIEPVGHGLVRFTLPGFAAYVRRLDQD